MSQDDHDASGRTFWVATLIASFALVGSLWVVDYLPTNDGPYHILSTYLENHLEQVDEPYRSGLVEHPPPTQNGFSSVFVLAEHFLPWRSAFRFTLSFWCLLWAWGVVALTRSCSPRRSWVSLLAFPAALQWALYMGFVSFIAATSVGFFVLALFCSDRPTRARHRLLAGGLLLLQAWLHLFPAAITGLVLCLLVLAGQNKESRLKELGWLVLVGSPAALLVLYVLLHTSTGIAHTSPTLDWLSPTQAIQPLFRACFVGPLWRCVPLVSLGLLGIILTLVGRNEPRRVERALAIGAVFLLMAGLLAPINMQAWELFSVRFFPLGLGIALALLPLPSPKRAKQLAIAAVVIFSTASMAWSYSFHRELERACAPALEGITADLDRSGFRLFVPWQGCFGDFPGAELEEIPHVKLLFAVGSLYAVEQGGLAFFFHGGEMMHHFTLYAPERLRQLDPNWRYLRRSLGPEPSPEAVVNMATYLGELGSHYEDLIFFGEGEVRQAILDRGYESDWESDLLMIARFVGCPLSIELPATWGAALPAIVQYGWWPRQDPSFERVFREVEDIPIVGNLSHIPCGDVWVRAFQDTDESGDWNQGDTPCLGADEEGRTIHLVESEPQHFVCRSPE